jgi:hypothetical protein
VEKVLLPPEEFKNDSAQLRRKLFVKNVLFIQRIIKQLE